MANNIFVEGLRVFTGTLTDNDLLHIKVKRRADMPADEDMGVRYSSFINMLNLGRFALKAGDNITGDFVFSNNRGIFGKTVAGASRVLIKVGTDDKIAVGTSTSAMKLFSLSDIVANINNVDYTMYHSGNSNLNSIDWRARDLVADRTLWVNGSSTFGAISIRNGSSLSFKDSGNTDVPVLTADATANLTVGNAGKTTTLIGTSLKYGANTILHTGNYTGTLDGRYVLKTQTVNNKALSGNITLTPADVGAVNKAGDVMTNTLFIDVTGAFKGLTIGSQATPLINLSAGHEGHATVYISEANDNTKSGFIVRTVNAAGYGVTTLFRVDSAGELYAKGTSKVYHVDNKPTPAELGVLPSTGGVITGDLSVQGNISLPNGTIFPARALPDVAAGVPNGMYMGMTGATAVGEYLPYLAVVGFNAGADTTRHFQIASGTEGNTFYIRTAHTNSGTASGFFPWRRIYTDANKPTAADVGLGSNTTPVFAGLRVTGEVITMRSPATQGVNIKSWNATGRHNIFEVGDDAGYFFYAQRTTSGSSTIAFDINGSTTVRGEVRAHGRVFVDTNNEVYSPVNKPSASDLGVMNASIATVSSADWDTLTQAGSYTVNNANGTNFPSIVGHPTVYNYGVLLVQSTGAIITQVYIPDGSSNIYTRAKWGTNAWREWSVNASDLSSDIRASIDLDLLTVGGTFNMYKASGVTFTNAPANFDFGTLQVIGRGNGALTFVTQILTWKNDGHQMIRTRNDGSRVWTPWYKVYSENQKPTAADVGLSNVPNTVHSANPDASTVPLRDSTGDISARLFRATYADQNTISGGLVFRINNSTDNYLRVCTDKGAIRDWLGVSANSSASQNWADIVGKGVVITAAGVAEMGKFIDLRETGSNLDYNTRLESNSAGLRISTNLTPKSLFIGCRNDSWAHFDTDSTNGFYFYKRITSINGFSTKEEDGNVWAGHFYCEPQGGAWVDWQARKTSLQVSCPNSAAAYPIWRASQWGSRHLAAMEVYAGGSNTAEPTAVMHVGSRSNAFTWFESGDYNIARNLNANDVYIRSDASLKTNVKPLENSLAGLMKLEPSEYDKRQVDSDDYDMHEEGLIAQLVEEQFPNAVHTDKQTGLKSLKPYALIARLIHAVQEQQQQIDDLKKLAKWSKR